MTTARRHRGRSGRAAPSPQGVPASSPAVAHPAPAPDAGSDTGRNHQPPPPPGDAIDAWLGVLGGLLGRGASVGREVLDELEGHLRDRARDLMVSGVPEAVAIHQSISELGDAALLARRFKAVHRTPRRRTLMNASLLAVAGSALALSVVSLVSPAAPAADGPSAGSPVVFTPQPASTDLARRRLRVDMIDAPVADLFSYIGATLDKPVAVDWPTLSDAGVPADMTVSLAARDEAFSSVLRKLNLAFGLSDGSAIDWRVADGVLEFSSRDAFDRREMMLVCYDLGGLLGSGLNGEEIVLTLQTLAEPDLWRDNGGDLAWSAMLGDKLFIEAPPRVHARAGWILNQLGAGAEPTPMDKVGSAISK